MFNYRSIVGLFICLPFLGALSEAADPVRIDVTRDAWISAYSGEQEGNNGAAPRLKLKGIQEFFLIDFDPTPFQGKKVRRAELRLKSASDDKALRITVSTVMTDWNEGDGTNYAKGTDGCSFQWAIGGKQRWGGDGTDVTAVTLGNGGSIWSFGDATKPDEDGWQRIPVAPEILQARMDGESFGFLVMDDVGSEYERTGNRFEYRLMPNRFFFSKDQNRASAPYFVVWFEDGETTSSSADLAQIANRTNETNQRKTAIVEFASILQSARDGKKPETGAVATDDLMRLDGKPTATSTIGIAKGEAVSWVLKTPPESLQVSAPEGFVVDILALPQVEGRLDPAVPLSHWKPDAFGFSANHPVATCIDLYATKTVPAGEYAVKLEWGTNAVEIKIKVWDFTLPDRLSFIPQMNCYGLPANERSYFQLCHEHRTTLNSLRYGWSGKVSPDAVPKRNQDGSWDWSEWDRKWGPLLDGSAFANSRRGPIPTEAFYLPINENWPMDHEKHFLGGYWIEDAYAEDYWTEFRSVINDFARHFREREYNETLFEFYLNNKVYFKQQQGNRWDACSAAWIFDEPVNTQDFWALRRFGLEFWQGVKGISGPRFGYRIDISRPEWQRDLLDGISSVEVVSGSLRRYQERVTARANAHRNLVYMYGSANTFDQSTDTNVAWCVETWARGANGVVPWQTMGTKESWRKLDPLAVIYPSDQGAIPSLRLKSFRDGQQLVEYLEQFRLRSGVTSQELGELLLNDFGLVGKTVQAYEEDAGSVQFQERELSRLDDLRFALGEWLSRNPIRDERPQINLMPRQGLGNLGERSPISITP